MKTLVQIVIGSTILVTVISDADFRYLIVQINAFDESTIVNTVEWSMTVIIVAVNTLRLGLIFPVRLLTNHKNCIGSLAQKINNLPRWSNCFFNDGMQIFGA